MDCVLIPRLSYLLYIVVWMSLNLCVTWFAMLLRDDCGGPAAALQRWKAATICVKFTQRSNGCSAT